VELEIRQLDRRYESLRTRLQGDLQERTLVTLEGRDAIVVDDGIATGGSAEAAVRVVRRHDPAQIVVAVPVAAESGVSRLASVADEVVCPLAVRGSFAVGSWYDDFHQLDDGEVAVLLR
jgi:putative phosphoribosyl transferase